MRKRLGVQIKTLKKWICVPNPVLPTWMKAEGWVRFSDSLSQTRSPIRRRRGSLLSICAFPSQVVSMNLIKFIAFKKVIFFA